MGNWSVGDRIIAVTGFGGLAEKVVIPARSAFRLPEERSFQEGAALLLTYATSIHALLDRGKLQAGQTLLVLGAAGGVGLAAVELGKAYEARVIAAVSSEEKAQAARDAGADEAIVYPTGPSPRRSEGAGSALPGRRRAGRRGRDIRPRRRRLHRSRTSEHRLEGVCCRRFPAGIANCRST